MSANEVRNQIEVVRKSMTHFSSFSLGQITNDFLSRVNLLQQKYGAFLGQAKSEHLGYSQELDELAESIETYFALMAKDSDSHFCFKLVNMAIGKISEMVSFVEGLNESKDNVIAKSAFDDVIKKNEALKQTLEFMVRFKGLPELNELLETAKNSKLDVDEHWVLALCSINLIEASVNKKLEELNISQEGSFEKKYSRLINGVKKKENRDIQQLLPLALYKGVRNKLDHGSHAHKVTPKEAKQISQLVRSLINELFQ